MFPSAYFAPRYFAPRYWPPVLNLVFLPDIKTARAERTQPGTYEAIRIQPGNYSAIRVQPDYDATEIP